MSEQAFAEEVAKADVLINCIYAYPGMKVPVVTREMVRSMRKGSVIVDLEGEGIIETAQYTTISNPYFIEEGTSTWAYQYSCYGSCFCHESYSAYHVPYGSDCKVWP